MNISKIINYLENKYINKNLNYNFKVGDNITIYYSNTYKNSLTKKKSKNYIIYKGYVISIKGDNKFNKTFILRQVINNIGVEIVFHLYSPNLEKIIVNIKGKVKRSKLYYIRNNNYIKIKKRK
ncbi:MAG: 50S ribosomal protein L19 [Candidatus Shikimatogenerans sp. JK-2022]|nr:50S ribosomal protein L19 [Candidatus Shikimatogenerans bostrichidophilus]